MLKYLLTTFIIVTSLFGLTQEEKDFFASLKKDKADAQAKEKDQQNRNKKLNAKKVIEATKRSSSNTLKSSTDRAKRELKIKEILDTADYLEKRLEAKKKLLGARNRIKILKDLLKSEDYNRYKINTSRIDNIFFLGNKQKIVLTGAKMNEILKYLVDDFNKKQAEKKGAVKDLGKKIVKKEKEKESPNIGYKDDDQVVLENGDLITFNPNFIINFVKVENSYAIFKIALK
jgi:hypothetical protein